MVLHMTTSKSRRTSRALSSSRSCEVRGSKLEHHEGTQISRIFTFNLSDGNDGRRNTGLVRRGKRLSKSEGTFLLRNAELLELGGLANEIRFAKNPRRAVTYVLDTNPNYSNVCNIDCIFCAFYRHPGEEGEYTCLWIT